MYERAGVAGDWREEWRSRPNSIPPRAWLAQVTFENTVQWILTVLKSILHTLIMMREWLSLTALYPSCWCSGQQKGGGKGQGEGQQAASYTHRLILKKFTNIIFSQHSEEHPFPSEQCDLSWLGCCGWLLAVQTFRFWRSPLLPPIVNSLRGTWHSSWAGLFMLMNQTLSKSHFHFFSFPSGRNLVRRATAGALRGLQCTELYLTLKYTTIILNIL